MMKTAALSFATLCLTALVGRADIPSATFERYQPILDRKPFGEGVVVDPNAAAAAAAAATGQDALSKQYRPCSIVEVDGGGMRVGLVDLKNNNKSIFLTVGEEGEDGLKVVSANYATEEAVLQKGGETATVKIQAGPAAPGPAAPGGRPPGMMGGPPQSMSFLDRRRQRDEIRQGPPPAAAAPQVMPQPKLSGEALEQHLRNYQMEVIRQGMPPLPVPLTPEMDSQLVKEGVLPAQ